MDLFSVFEVLSRFLYLCLHITTGGSFPKPLSAKKEMEALLRLKEGDTKAKDLLIEHNLRLVVHIIKKYYSNFKEQDDLISIGTIGLIKAVTTFDCEKGTRFATYASRCIENEILMYFRGKKKSAQDIYISDPIDTDKDGNSLTLMDVVADSENILDDLDIKMKAEKLYRLMDKTLDARERQILYLRYGLMCTGALTQREVAQKLGISRSYVSRIEKKALETLRPHFEKDR